MADAGGIIVANRRVARLPRHKKLELSQGASASVSLFISEVFVFYDS